MAYFGSDYSGLAHHWVYNNDNSHCYGYRMYSEGDTIYSYGSHFPLARKVEVGNETVYLITSKSSSNTTNKQKNEVIRAIPFGAKMFVVDDLYNHKNAIKGWFDDIEHLTKKLARAKSKKEDYQNEIDSIIRNIKDYTNLFKTKYRFNKHEKEILNNLNFGSLPNLLEQREKLLRKNEKARQRRAEKKEIEKAKIELEQWLNGEIRYLRSYLNRRKIYLRINGDFVETSEGIKVSRQKSKILFDRIEKNKDIKGFKIDIYTTIGIIDDHLVVGCHNIPMSEVKRVGKLL